MSFYFLFQLQPAIGLTNSRISKASGNLGVHVSNAFVNSQYKVSILTRKDSSSKFQEGTPVFKADYSDQSQLESAMQGQDIVICMVAIFATGDQQTLVDAAIAAGVKIFIPSEFGPPSRDERFAALHPALPPKVATVDYLRWRHSGLHGLYFACHCQGDSRNAGSFRRDEESIRLYIFFPYMSEGCLGRDPEGRRQGMESEV